jgi:serine/threonine-protein kinase
VIGDFGLTQRTGASEPEGTVGYMAPERFNGQVRTKNDVYSFAVTAAVAVSGDQRNENSTVEDTQLRMMHILAGDIPKPPFFPSGRLPPPVYEIICQAFSENPAERPAMEEILALLHAGDPTNAVSAPRSQARHARGQWRFRGL